MLNKVLVLSEKCKNIALVNFEGSSWSFGGYSYVDLYLTPKKVIKGHRITLATWDRSQSTRNRRFLFSLQYIYML